eukprot:4385466-Lingulodinium_polyedra.AAC.1
MRDAGVEDLKDAIDHEPGGVTAIALPGEHSLPEVDGPRGGPPLGLKHPWHQVHANARGQRLGKVPPRRPLW